MLLIWTNHDTFPDQWRNDHPIDVYKLWSQSHQEYQKAYGTVNEGDIC